MQKSSSKRKFIVIIKNLKQPKLPPKGIRQRRQNKAESSRREEIIKFGYEIK